jgi:hypothetical protein
MTTFKPFIFVSYAHEDSRWFEKGSLMPRLIPSLQRANAEVWYDKGRIGGADIWRNEIDNAIDRADIAVLLVSQFFLNSDFIMRVELPRLTKRAEEDQLILFPILVGYCAWESIEALSRPQMVPGEPTPLVEYLEPLAKWERVQYDIMQALLRQIEKIKKRREKIEARPAQKHVVTVATEPGPRDPQALDVAPPPPKERKGWIARIGSLVGLGSDDRNAQITSIAPATLARTSTASAEEKPASVSTTVPTARQSRPTEVPRPQPEPEYRPAPTQSKTPSFADGVEPVPASAPAARPSAASPPASPGRKETASSSPAARGASALPRAASGTESSQPAGSAAGRVTHATFCDIRFVAASISDKNSQRPSIGSVRFSATSVSSESPGAKKPCIGTIRFSVRSNSAK